MKLILLEDDPLIAVCTEDALREAGFEVLSTGSGEDACEPLRSNPEVVAVMIDVRLGGGLDGWAVAQRVRASRPHMPIVYTTTAFGPDFSQHGVDRSGQKPRWSRQWMLFEKRWTGQSLAGSSTATFRLPSLFRHSISRVGLFWAAFILTRPLGATMGDFLDKPVAKGGFELSRPIASAVLAVVIIALILILPQRPGSHPGEAET